MMDKRYSELIRFRTFDERFNYLKLRGGVGHETFGYDRWLNQQFYSSREWQDVRQFVIVRDNGCDLGVPGHEIFTELLVHHMNPMTADHIAHHEPWILDPEYLITTKHDTHNAIHYGLERAYPPTVVERSPGDTKLW